MTASNPSPTATQPDPIQKRTVATLSMSQILGGVSLASGVAVGALLAEEVSGSPTYAGLGSTFQVIGSALIAIPLARVSAARGRRPGLALGYALSFIGALGLIVSGIVGSFALLLAASLLFGGSTASNNQARYAAADLAEPAHRGRDLSLVVWATTIGSVLGPNLVGPSQPVSEWLGIPRLTGPFVFSLVGLTLAIAVLLTRLRPDPLLEARRRLAAADPTASSQTHGSIGRGLRVIASRPQALLGVLTLALGHVTMVSVMVMTPLHMRHGHADLTVIGFVISMHILGMFAFSPLTGMAVDRLGGRTVAFVGAGILATATLLASTAPQGHSTRLLIALFLLGLGWSCTLVSGSTLLTAAVPTVERPGAQGASDLVMGLAAGGGGALAGVVVDVASFHALALGALGIAALIAVSALVLRGSGAADPPA
ncbi:MFS transporter [Knoellia subterranea]|uniref:Transporter n=1 Tax=Knoellia subterranea KCTC 19937 TaxID=1385521 RepID=A0A0A0JHE5_9MICO|nr:MFS transporter [Knoellia subterranea]KGN36518.1 transporter [Knoellia subterranea KCTC 19937]